ncbi:unnamed protein product [Owenia fusiformis]|uniref:Uncharacterized protein n=1 Tax=Owenia fusiformis TaxID=6347 RepID=A0A8J1TB35_OWEFU|nr:unnamed protein product [Owenia fusiformis]
MSKINTNSNTKRLTKSAYGESERRTQPREGAYHVNMSTRKFPPPIVCYSERERDAQTLNKFEHSRLIRQLEHIDNEKAMAHRNIKREASKMRERCSKFVDLQSIIADKTQVVRGDERPKSVLGPSGSGCRPGTAPRVTSPRVVDLVFWGEKEIKNKVIRVNSQILETGSIRRSDLAEIRRNLSNRATVSMPTIKSAPANRTKGRTMKQCHCKGICTCLPNGSNHSNADSYRPATALPHTVAGNYRSIYHSNSTRSSVSNDQHHGDHNITRDITVDTGTLTMKGISCKRNTVETSLEGTPHTPCDSPKSITDQLSGKSLELNCFIKTPNNMLNDRQETDVSMETPVILINGESDDKHEHSTVPTDNMNDDDKSGNENVSHANNIKSNTKIAESKTICNQYTSEMEPRSWIGRGFGVPHRPRSHKTKSRFFVRDKAEYELKQELKKQKSKRDTDTQVTFYLEDALSLEKLRSNLFGRKVQKYVLDTAQYIKNISVNKWNIKDIETKLKLNT